MSNTESCRMLYTSGGQGELFCPHGRFSPDFCKSCHYEVTAYKPCNIHSSAKIGGGTRISAFCDIGYNVVIGKNCNIQAHVTISNECRVGDNVFIGPNTSLLNDKYPVSHLIEPVIIKNNVVIGGGVTVLPGVTVYEGVVICAGSVVTKDAGPDEVVVGNPAKRVMMRWDYDDKQKLRKFKAPKQCPKCGAPATHHYNTIYYCHFCEFVEIENVVIDAKEMLAC